MPRPKMPAALEYGSQSCWECRHGHGSGTLSTAQCIRCSSGSWKTLQGWISLKLNRALKILSHRGTIPQASIKTVR